MKPIKVKRNIDKTLADWRVLGYTNPMQYKIPIQIENEDTIVAGLSLRQLVIMMVWGGMAYGIFKSLEPNLGSEISLIFALPFAIIGVIIALMRISEMTFLPAMLSFFRLTLNTKSRLWSIGTDSYSDLDVGYVILPTKAPAEQNKTLESIMDDEVTLNIWKL